MYTIDLNCDLGESYGAYHLGMDEEIIPLISSANVACGFHAGDFNTMANTAKLCAENGISIGAHPGFPDMQGFGRRNMNLSPAEARNLITCQIGALYAFCRSAGARLRHVKPHGALYNMAAKDPALAKAICQGIHSFDPSLILLGLSGSEMLKQAKVIGLPYAAEVFADRAYEDDGTLVARSKRAQGDLHQWQRNRNLPGFRMRPRRQSESPAVREENPRRSGSRGHHHPAPAKKSIISIKNQPLSSNAENNG